MAGKSCAVTDCDRAARARGWCTKHWRRWRTYGDPLYSQFVPMRGSTDEQRFWARVEVTGFCWNWLGAREDPGHGVFALGAQENWRTVRAHRFAYEYLVGPIPEGLILDHLCRNPPCVNPDHLDPVTSSVNTLRGFSPSVVINRQGTCAQGHDLTRDAAVYVNPTTGRRQCRVCIRNRDRRYRERKRQQTGGIR